MHDPLEIPTPFDRYQAEIRPEWIDYNGHMNVAYYVLLFDYATDALWSYLGIGEDYLKRTNHSTFALESHITYRGEVKLGDSVRVTSQLLGVDTRRLHFFHRMYHSDQGYLAATLESVCLHVSMATRRAAPFPEDRQAFLGRVFAAHQSLGVPEDAGRRISLERRGSAR
jgi:acyl-CoA thioester hydrolase